jgi:hypothetical protein
MCVGVAEELGEGVVLTCSIQTVGISSDDAVGTEAADCACWTRFIDSRRERQRFLEVKRKFKINFKTNKKFQISFMTGLSY